MKKMIKNTFLIFALSALFISCKKDKNQEEELIKLTDNAYNAKVLPGRNRAKISFAMTDEIRKCDIFWNNKKKSRPIEQSDIINKTVDILIENLDEGPITFEIVTYDDQNKHSTTLVKTDIYGDNYFENLTNREVRELFFRFDEEANIEWLNPKKNDVGMEISYTDKDDKLRFLKVGKNVSVTALPNYKANTNLTYRSLYLPEDHAIDTLWLDIKTIPAPTYYSKAVGSILSKSGLVNKFIAQTYLKVQNGIEYASMQFSDVANSPYSLNILRVDLNDPKISLRTITPNNGTAFGFQTVKLMAENLQNSGQNVIGAINADFFSGTGVPQGPVFANGTIIKSTANTNTIPYFAIKNDGKPEIGMYTTLLPSTYDQYREMVGGSAKLVSGGTTIAFNDSTKEPRTFIGYSINNIVYLVVVDGRQSTHSVGMTFDQMASVMGSLGAQEAINLDGGGSTTMVLKNSSNVFDIKNKYSDANPRAVANGLAVVFNP